MLLAVALFAACDETIETPETLEVKPYNIEGAWMLAELNGATLADSTYVYLVIDRGYTYEIYENTASMPFTLPYLLSSWRVASIPVRLMSHMMKHFAPFSSAMRPMILPIPDAPPVINTFAFSNFITV